MTNQNTTDPDARLAFEPLVRPTCDECGSVGPVKRGWTNGDYCSELCERSAVARLHASMPGGPSPYRGWMPRHIEREIQARWA